MGASGITGVAQVPDEVLGRRRRTGAVVAITVKTAVSPDLSSVAGETSLTPFVLPIWFSSLTSRGSLAGVFRNASCWEACFSCLVGGCEATSCSACCLRLVGRHALGLELRGRLLDRLLLLLLLLLL